MANNQPACVFIKSGTSLKGTLWGLTAANTYSLIRSASAKLQLTVAGALSGLYTIDGVTPSAGDMILVTQGTPSTDGLYLAAAGAWAKVALVSALPDGFQVNVWAGNSAPSIYIAQG